MKHNKRDFSQKVTIFYFILALLLIPWTIFLAYVLPIHYNSHHWTLTWVGFDIFEIILFLSTSILAFKKSSLTAISAAMLGTVLLIDAWFDTLTARPGLPAIKSLADAIFVEIPLALLSFYISKKIWNNLNNNHR